MAPFAGKRRSPLQFHEFFRRSLADRGLTLAYPLIELESAIRTFRNHDPRRTSWTAEKARLINEDADANQSETYGRHRSSDRIPLRQHLERQHQATDRHGGHKRPPRNLPDPLERYPFLRGWTSSVHRYPRLSRTTRLPSATLMLRSDGERTAASRTRHLAASLVHAGQIM